MACSVNTLQVCVGKLSICLVSKYEIRETINAKQYPNFKKTRHVIQMVGHMGGKC